ncbi:hypothetical protein [Saccharopolyspora sp. 6V]|uniref:hypothetical protein n=1 Tax=Saccharopolyspora sp. 6V TaxID=2877239 RepID=UPI001CD27AE5|nr:hypothetical protein [Saccharopolyspora sp. 6V]MCA1195142.1 hypothetical protein [Saccharopolyspora sp. 6V]
MDVAGVLAAVAPQAGIGGLLLALLVYVMRHASSDRTDYRAALADAEARHAAELARVNAAHDSELAELRDRLDAQEKRTDELAQLLDDERRRRWHAEDAAAAARREADT